jgi:hypothetical protein
MSDEVFIPVAVDAVRFIEGEELVRVTNFAATTDAPGSCGSGTSLACPTARDRAAGDGRRRP